MDGHGLEEHELIERINWLIKIRYLAILFVVILATTVRFALRVDFGYFGVLAVLGVVLVYNFFFNFVNETFLHKIDDLDRKALVANRFANFQSFLDIAALTVILHFIGSIEAPFAFYYIFHMIFLAILLSRLAAFLHATFAMVLFGGMVALEYFGIIGHIHPTRYLDAELYRNPFYIAGNLFVLVTTVYFSVWLTISIIYNLRGRETQIIELSDELEKRAISCELAYDELRETTLEKARYVRKISHELKSPVAAIQSLAQTALGGYVGEVPPEQRKLLGSIIRRSSDMASLIRDMLTLAKTREALPYKAAENVDLTELVRLEIGKLSSEINKKGLAISMNLSQSVEVKGFKEELAEVVKNLLENAVKYSRKGGRISVVVGPEKRGARIVISDNGIGIDEKEIEVIFEEFYRSAEAKKISKEGTGLGLSIVKEIIDKHNGKIEVVSSVGKGTTFNIYIPKYTGVG